VIRDVNSIGDVINYSVLIEKLKKLPTKREKKIKNEQKNNNNTTQNRKISQCGTSI
jgi:hypothetical protein